MLDSCKKLSVNFFNISWTIHGLSMEYPWGMFGFKKGHLLLIPVKTVHLWVKQGILCPYGQRAFLYGKIGGSLYWVSCQLILVRSSAGHKTGFGKRRDDLQEVFSKMFDVIFCVV